MTNTTPGRYDVFLSYPSADRAQALALKTALEALGLDVWLDTERIDDATSIQRSIEHGLARSRLLVAWYSETYAHSRPCQWELTAALIVQQSETCTVKRVLVVNPIPDVSHIAQTSVRDLELISAAGGQTMAALAQQLKDAGAQAQGLLGDVRQLTRPLWYGSKKGLGSTRFVGRLSELWQVQNALTRGRYAIVTGQPSPGAATALASVRGGGGMGKSLLAEEYASRFGCFWSGGVFWIDAMGVSDRPEDTPATLAPKRQAYYLEQLGLFVTALDKDINIQGLDLRQLRAHLKRHLHQRGQPYLWLVDDLPACSHQELQDWLAPCDLGATLLTSRTRQHEAAGALVELGILPPDDAYALLCRERQPHNDAEEAAARSIVQRLGGHAMAIDQARATCVRQGFSDFLARLDQHDQNALALSATLAGELPSGHERDIAKTFLGSINGLSPDAMALLTLSAQLSSAPISRNLITACKQAHDQAAQQDAAMAADPNAALFAAQDWADLGMTELSACSLADPADAAPATPDARIEPAITVHTLIARVARWHSKSQLLGFWRTLFTRLTRRPTAHASQAAAPWRQAAVGALMHTLQDSGDMSQHAALVHDAQHARQLCEQADTLEEAMVLAYVAQYDDAKGLYALSRTAREHVLTVCQRVLGPKHPATLTSMNNLAGTLRAMGNLPAARIMEEQVLAVRQHALGPEHLDTLVSMNNLAGTLKAMGELPAARAMQEQVLAVHQRVLRPEHPDTLTSMNNLADTLRAMSELPSARAMQEQVLAVHQRVLGPEHPATLASMNNLAGTLKAMGELPAARAMQEQVLAVRQRVPGLEYPVTLTSMNNLAETLRAMGELPAARDMQEQVLTVSQRVLGPEHPDTLSSMNNLAETLRAMGKLPAARAMQEQVLAARQRLLGAEHPDTIDALGNLLHMLHDAKDQNHINAVAAQYPATFAKLQGR